MITSKKQKWKIYSTIQCYEAPLEKNNLIQFLTISIGTTGQRQSRGYELVGQECSQETDVSKSFWNNRERGEN